MKKTKQTLATLMQLSLAAITFVAMLSGGFWLMGEKELARKVLTFGLIPLIAWFGGVTTLYLGQDSVDIVPESVEIAQEQERIMPSMYGVDEKLHFVNVVIDGDTITVDGKVKVRLLGIDAPEPSECYYNEARIALINLVEGERVRLEKDVEAADDFGRLLRYVFLPSNDLTVDDIFVNEYMLRNGYARIYSNTPNDRYRDYFVSARERALKQGTGLWGACEEFATEYEEELGKRREAHEDPTDPNCIIKGNISQKGAGKVYFLPNCGMYSSVKIDTSKGEQYFCTEKEAQAAGFRKAGGCK